MTPPQIRPYQPSDEETLRRICCDTALYGQPIDPLFSDRRLVGDYLLGYYTRFEPESIFVAEMDGRIVGYLTGCEDTRRFERLFARRLAPKLLLGFMKRGHWLRARIWRLFYAIIQSERRWANLQHSAAAPYPAHCHVNLDPGFRQAGTGSALLTAFLNHLCVHRISGIHIVTGTDAGKAFFAKSGFNLLAKHPSPKLPGLLEQPEVWVMGKAVV